ncbi:hypothetical protein [Mycolicibacterium celeriflavum]|nr:hypothetical protein [Mycolicibacterium celeriflavum]
MKDENSCATEPKAVWRRCRGLDKELFRPPGQSCGTGADVADDGHDYDTA